MRFNTASGKYCCNFIVFLVIFNTYICFNTASGKYCCNEHQIGVSNAKFVVSIPQAVSTVATAGLTKPVFMGLKNRFWKTSHRKR